MISSRPWGPTLLVWLVLSFLGVGGVVFVITSIRNYGEERGAILVGILGVVAVCWVVFVFFAQLSGIEAHATHLSLRKFFNNRVIQIAWEDMERIDFYRLPRYGAVIMRIRMKAGKGLPICYRISSVGFAPSWARYPPWMSFERFVDEIEEKGRVPTRVRGDLNLARRGDDCRSRC